MLRAKAKSRDQVCRDCCDFIPAWAKERQSHRGSRFADRPEHLTESAATPRIARSKQGAPIASSADTSGAGFSHRFVCSRVEANKRWEHWAGRRAARIQGQASARRRMRHEGFADRGRARRWPAKPQESLARLTLPLLRECAVDKQCEPRLLSAAGVARRRLQERRARMARERFSRRCAGARLRRSRTRACG